FVENLAEEEVFFARKASGLVRELSPIDAAIWAFSGAAVSGMTFYTIRMDYRFPGASPFDSFMLVSLLLFPIALTLSLVMAAMPRSGGLYVAVSRTLGPEIGFFCLWGMIIGWGIAIGLLSLIGVKLLASLFVMYGITGAIWAQSGAGNFILGLILVVLFSIFAMMGLKLMKWVVRILSYIPLAMVILVCCYWVATGSGTANAAASGVLHVDVSQFIAKATSLGYTPAAFSWSATIASFVIPLWAWTGFEAITYAGGEVKSPKSTMLYGFNVGYLIVWFVYILNAFAVYYAWSGIIGPYNFLYHLHPDVLSTYIAPIEPSVPLFAFFSAGGGIVGLLIACLIMIVYVKVMPPIFVAVSRMIFALSFDRSLPPSLSNVDSRGTPRIAIAITAVWGVVGLIIAALSLDMILGILDFTMLGFFWIMGVAALILPYKKKEIYETSPVRWSIAGIPVISILGLLTVIVGFFVFAFSIMEFDYSVAATMSIFYGIGYLAFAVQQARNAKEGIDPSKIYAVLPPA
ncbi:MAG TPA: APC family permease, partial [Candidatus Dormibacteraeota bacterium]|nr:APC family permease [Candidatus Dormibacteraeota bacterium]